MNVARILAFLTITASVWAETTPLDEILPEAEIVTIKCELSIPPDHSKISVFDSPKDSEAALGTYSYKLWLPKGYHDAPQKRWPAVFIMSASGNAGVGGLQPAIEDRICIMLVEAKNGPWGPIVGNFLAAHDDAVKRLRIEEGRKIATGFSGGARGSSVFVQARPGFSGLILQGAGAAFGDDKAYLVKDLKRASSLRVAMTMGKSDNNRSEIARMEPELPKSRFKVFEFDGGHTWAPLDVFSKALAFVEGKGAPSAGTPSGSSFDDIFKKK